MTRRTENTVPKMSIARDWRDFPIANVAVTKAVLGKTNEYLVLVSNKRA